MASSPRRSASVKRAAGGRCAAGGRRPDLGAHGRPQGHIPLKLPYPADEPRRPTTIPLLFHLNPSPAFRGRGATSPSRPAGSRSGTGSCRSFRRTGWRTRLLVNEVWAPSTFIAEASARRPGSRSASFRIRRWWCRSTGPSPGSGSAFRNRGGSSFPPSTSARTGAQESRMRVLRAFRDAFPTDGEAPLLLIKYHRARDRDGRRAHRTDKGDAERARHRPSVTQEEMRDIYAASDAFVSLHRSEGFGLNLLDMMALGQVCIATGFSGNLDFMSPREQPAHSLDDARRPGRATTPWARGSGGRSRTTTPRSRRSASSARRRTAPLPRSQTGRHGHRPRLLARAGRRNRPRRMGSASRRTRSAAIAPPRAHHRRLRTGWRLSIPPAPRQGLRRAWRDPPLERLRRRRASPNSASLADITFHYRRPRRDHEHPARDRAGRAGRGLQPRRPELRLGLVRASDRSPPTSTPTGRSGCWSA